MAALWVFPLLFLLENILGGPLGLLPSISSRYLLFAGALGALAVVAISARGRIETYAVLPLGAIGCFLLWNIGWATVVPVLSGTPLELAASEADAFLLLLLPMLFIPASGGRVAVFYRMLRWVVIATSCLAWVQFCIWLLGSFHPELQGELRRALVTFFHGNAVYVGPMQSGFFRVFWISSLWLLPSLFYAPLILKKRRWLILAMTGLLGSLVASYSRGLWMGVAAGGLIWMLMRCTTLISFRLKAKHVLFTPIFLVLIGSLSYWTGSIILDRLEGLISSQDPSVSIRLEQTSQLLDAWENDPFFGSGYGASAAEVRDPSTPYSYEVVPIALLMKLGLIGLLGFVGFFLIVAFSTAHLIHFHPQESSALLGGLTAFLIAAMSNPMLINFVGMTILSVMLVHWIFLFRPVFGEATHDEGIRA